MSIALWLFRQEGLHNSQANADADEMVYRYPPPIAAALQTSTQQLPYPRFNHHHDGSWCHGHNIGFWSELILDNNFENLRCWHSSSRQSAGLDLQRTLPLSSFSKSRYFFVTAILLSCVHSESSSEAGSLGSRTQPGFSYWSGQLARQRSQSQRLMFDFQYSGVNHNLVNVSVLL